MDEINPTVLVIVAVVIAVLTCGILFSSYWPVPACAGVVLILWAKFAPAPDTNGGHALMAKETEVYLPTQWDERQIGTALEQYKDNPPVLGRFVDGIISRFVMGQAQQTIETRTRYLESFNKYAAIARESYKWHRYLRGGRAELEEDAEDAKVRVALREQQAKLDQLDLDAEIERAKKLLELKKIQKQAEDLDRPAPPPAPPPTPPRQPSAREIREERRRSLKLSEKDVKEEIEITRSDPTLSEELRQRKFNTLEERLAEIQEELVQLL